MLDKVAIGNLIVNPDTYVEDARYHDLMRDVRASDPLMWVEPEGYRPFWLASKYADIRAIQAQQAKYLNRPRSFLLTAEEENDVFAATGEYVMTRSVIQVDGDEHLALRRVAQEWFMPGALRNIEATIRGIAREIIDDMAKQPGEFDFAKDVALWYPLRVIMTILGIPREDGHILMAITQGAFSSDDPDAGLEPGLAGIKNGQELAASYFTRVTEDRRASPRGDVASVIANARIDGALLTDLEATSYYLTLATAGHDTTSSTLAGGLLALLQHPDQLRLLSENPALLKSSAIDEMLRWVTPIKHFFRTAVDDETVRGNSIESGDAIMMCYPSGNRDEEQFVDPFDFRVDRKPNHHLAFGVGAHICLGMHLAKMELRIFFEELLPRLKHMALAGTHANSRANFVLGLKRLPVTIEVAPQLSSYA